MLEDPKQLRLRFEGQLTDLVEKQRSPLRELEPSAAPPETLTDREVQVLRLMVDGLENRSIAYALDITVGTAKNHVASILNKLGATGHVQAGAVLAARRRPS